MQTTEHHGVARLRKLAAVLLVLVAVPLIASCGGGGDEANGGGGGNGGQGGNGGGGRGGGGQGGGGGQPGGETGGQLVSDVRVIIATPDKQTLAGDRARLRGVEVRESVSERAFYVGENDAERLLVINTGEEGTEVSEGQEVVVVGRLLTPRPELEESLSLSPEEAAAVEEQEILLRAVRVIPQEG